MKRRTMSQLEPLVGDSDLQNASNLPGLPPEHEATISTLLERRMINSQTPKYPLLEAILAIKDLSLQPVYTNGDAAGVFGVMPRTIQYWNASGHLIPRNLPGGWKHFPQDLEDFLQASRKGGR